MLSAASIPVPVVEMVLALLVPLLLPFLDNDLPRARATAWQMLDDYQANTCEEFRLSGEIIGFSLQVMQALADAAQPGLSLHMLARFRSAAVSLRRSEATAQRKLDALQKARLACAKDESFATTASAKYPLPSLPALQGVASERPHEASPMPPAANQAGNIASVAPTAGHRPSELRTSRICHEKPGDRVVADRPGRRGTCTQCRPRCSGFPGHDLIGIPASARSVAQRQA